MSHRGSDPGCLGAMVVIVALSFLGSQFLATLVLAFAELVYLDWWIGTGIFFAAPVIYVVVPRRRK